MADLLPPQSTPGADLPVREALPGLVAALRARGRAVLVAPPGSGKTTLAPLALADVAAGTVLVAEPRRLATRAAAVRLAHLLGERPGGRVGYAMRGERRPGSRIEVVTTGLLLARLQRDPELPGVGAVVLDEVHERHLDADLALAFAVDVQATLRPDLLLVATSATPDTERLVAALDDAPVVRASAVTWPLEVVWAPPASPLPLLVDARVDPRLLQHVVEVVRRALGEVEGDVLVFVPGEAEVHGVVRRLSGSGGRGLGVDVLPLYGRQAAAEQDLALRMGARRRVVVTTSVAESSLTVPGVRTVVDAGLARAPRTDHRRGLAALVTGRVSQASATQRAGRAAREGPGRAYRCWSAAEHTHLEPFTPPEIAITDLAGFALTVAAWGAPGGRGLALLDPPPAAGMDAATTLLTGLGAVDAAGRVTARGTAMAEVGVHPRLARAVLDGAPRVGSQRAREVVALLSDDGLAGREDDLVARYRALRRGEDRAAAARWRDEVARLRRGGGAEHPRTGLSDEVAVGLVVALAHPDRLARARSAGSVDHLMAGGTGAVLDVGSALRGAAGGDVRWLAVAVADRPVGRADARIRSAAPVDEAVAREVGPVRTVEEVLWSDGALVTRRRELLGAIVLRETPLAHPDPVAVVEAVRSGVTRSGLGVLRWTPAAEQLRARMAFCHHHLGPPWPGVSDSALLAGLDAWLGPDLVRVRRSADLGRIDLTAALRRLLPWPAATRFDALAPERLPVPTGSTAALTYSPADAPAEPPVLALKVQEAFGWTGSPRLADGRAPVVLHLLSPAGRPVAVTSDLASFWAQGYPQVRADLRGRYPRHPWPEDPLTATPTRRVSHPRR
ncbi:ATP-dependent helicase HrpB [Rhodococcus antarcticus]|uniref:ATP-dependent helicase HrpB n=1 Tax=Rhodococcus antarcticus TaxID=2987751 RepID=A0ABY6NXP8_9NOCA|nr:ATP-dependent helicase HrpB [Rhodococcus antarcticus]UZJ24004.1 ATP-dependent helicase HrpB [Rhodococcus antarcticus]